MKSQDALETALYKQKLAHKSWANHAAARGLPPSDESSELVWELVVAYGESLQDFANAKDDIYKTARELATLLLPELPMKRIWGLYRDRLVQSVMEANMGGGEDQCLNLLAFANTLSSAYAEAQADLLKKQSLHDRAQSISRELGVAKRIQTHLLPKDVPEIPGFQFAGRLIPADEIGGDYWSVKYQKRDGTVTLKLADITGHGVAAATLVAAVKFISGGYYRGAVSAAEVIDKTNRDLAIDTPHDILVTMVYGWLKPATRELTLVNAGHSPVFLCRQNACEEVPITGPVLGVSDTTQYGELNYKLATNDIVFFGSDGITEAGTIQPFGVNRLKKVIRDSAHMSAAEIADRVVKAVTDYVPNPHDDISMVVVKVTDETPDTA